MWPIKQWVCTICHATQPGSGFPQRTDTCWQCGSNQLLPVPDLRDLMPEKGD